MYRKTLKGLLNIFLGSLVILFSLFLFIALISYNNMDPSFSTVKSSDVVLNSGGIVGSYISDIFIQMFGAASFVLAAIITKIGLNIFKSKMSRYNTLLKIAMFMLFIISFCALLSTFLPSTNYWGYETWGGVVGYYMTNLVNILPKTILSLIYILLAFISFVIIIDCSYRKVKINSIKLTRKSIKILKFFGKFLLKLLAFLAPSSIKSKINAIKNRLNRNKNEKQQYLDLIEKQIKKIEDLERYIKNMNDKKVEEIIEEKNNDNSKAGGLLSSIFSSKKKKPTKRKTSDKYALPEVKLLNSSNNNTTVITKDELKEQANDLLKVLKDFKINGHIVGVKAGPVITLHEFEPSAGTKSSRIINLADDIARNLKVKSARISVIPERNVVGIELPNKVRNTIFLKDVLMSYEYENTNYSLPLILGSNIAGETVLMDLAKAPHLLIAGTTGSGKSVCINTMILSLLYKFTPEECKMIMIDPKMLELSAYEGIPHLLMPVVTDPKKAVLALKWVVNEMESRYKTMSSLGVRNIYGYNEKVKEAIEDGEILTTKNLIGYDEYGEPIYENNELETKKLPFIVVVVDEMADLMITAGKDIEALIQRIAQMARAAGIHIIMATQRPSVDIITGVIKANFPSRISFLVSSKIDSKVIIGEQGAEQLLGMGDMLYMPNGGKINRAHGPFVSDGEVENVVKYIISQGVKPDYVKLSSVDDNEDDGGSFEITNFGSNNDDDLYKQAVEIIKRDGKVSISYIQRQLRIGYNKAANLVERMEKEGIVSAPNAMGKREILEN